MLFWNCQRFSLSDYPGHLAAVVFTPGCNFRCPFCHNPELLQAGRATVRAVEPGVHEGGSLESSTGSAQRPDRLSRQGSTGEPEAVALRSRAWAVGEVLDFLRTRRGQLDALVVTGGEPTLQTDLPAFLAAVKGLGYVVKLDTNGSQPQVLERLLGDSLVDCVAMDLKAPFEKYDRLAGVAVTLGHIRASVALLLDASQEVEFRTTTVKPLLRPEDVLALGSLLRPQIRYVLQPFVPTRVWDASLLGYASSFAHDELTQLCRDMRQRGIDCHVRHLAGPPQLARRPAPEQREPTPPDIL